MTTIDTESRDKLIDDLAEYPARLHELVADPDDDALTRAGPEGSWGVVEVLCHLRDWERIYLERLQRIVDEDEPTFESVDDSLWPIDRDYHAQDPRKVLERFSELRAKLVSLLEGLNAGDWAREGHMPRHGNITIGWYAERIARHDADHLAQVRKALRVEAVGDNDARQNDGTQ